MKHDLYALRGPFFAALVFAVALLVTWGAISFGYASMFNPTPEGVSQELMRAMKAHRYEATLSWLSQELQQQMAEEDLRDLGAALEKRHGGISEAHGQGQEEQGESATGTVLVKFYGGVEQELTFPLEKEDGLWTITSIEPLQDLAR